MEHVVQARVAALGAVAPRGLDRASVLERLRAVRASSLALAAPLSAEDQGAQSMEDASPVKWHLAHTTWFFEAVVLGTHSGGYEPFDARFGELFNSYYESLGPRHPRSARGLLTRPALALVLEYRAAVERALERFIETCDEFRWLAAAPLVELGLAHEEQHQELILTDVQHLLSLNLLRPSCLRREPQLAAREHDGLPLWVECDAHEARIGAGPTGFAFDNERAEHVVRLAPFELARDLVTNREYREFIDDAGYRRAELWLSDGWRAVNEHGWRAPLYWNEREGTRFTLYGERELELDEPVAHLSFYEAAAFAEWRGARLPTEFEWEAAARRTGAEREIAAGLERDGADPHPRAARGGGELRQLFGAVWQWTRSSYDPYPRFRPLAGAVGEYNGKFMVGQLVLRGGSCATPRGHSRVSYRNFFAPGARWQFSGLRLARDL